MGRVLCADGRPVRGRSDEAQKVEDQPLSAISSTARRGDGQAECSIRLGRINYGIGLFIAVMDIKDEWVKLCLWPTFLMCTGIMYSINPAILKHGD